MQESMRMIYQTLTYSLSEVLQSTVLSPATAVLHSIKLTKQRKSKNLPQGYFWGRIHQISSSPELVWVPNPFDRRLKRCLDFSLRCLKHPKNKRLFPINPNYYERVRSSESYTVNFASTVVSHPIRPEVTQKTFYKNNVTYNNLYIIAHCNLLFL